MSIFERLMLTCILLHMFSSHQIPCQHSYHLDANHTFLYHPMPTTTIIAEVSTPIPSKLVHVGDDLHIPIPMVVSS